MHTLALTRRPCCCPSLSAAPQRQPQRHYNGLARPQQVSASAVTMVAPAAVAARAQQLSKPVIVHEPATEAHLMAVLEEQQQRQQQRATAALAATSDATSTSNDSHHQTPASSGIMGLLSSALGRSRQDGGSSSSAAAARPIVIVAMFTASWCGPCTLVHREIARVPALFTQQDQVDLRVMVLDSETNAPLASRLGIHSLPTLLFLGPDASKPPILTQGYVSDRMIRDTAVRSAQFAGCNLHAKPVRL